MPRRDDDAHPEDPRQPEVGDDDVEGEAIQQLHRLFAAIRFNDLVAAFGQPLGHEAAERGLVVHEQQVGRRGRVHGANRLTHLPPGLADYRLQTTDLVPITPL